MFSHPVRSDCSRPQGLQHTRPLCPSPSPKVCSSSCSLHWWRHNTVSSSDALFSLCSHFFPASGTFPVSQLFTSDDQNTGISASPSVIPMSFQGWFPLRLTDLILLSKGLLGVFSSPTVIKSEKSKIEVLADSVSGEGPLLDSEMLPFCCNLTWWRGKGFFWVFSYKNSNPICEDSTCSPPNSITLGMRFQHMNIG